ncbi:unnamed protein product [Triticum turgidum subsp. durum]|uniref:F-box domain-containing protein n=1 Tax=Triticum turgidum subsp. durum TaxID=4567 RepID=A0A9R0YWG0_TRITD|nr:unnamed protein product [Triticum turgidum subsp. durum]
MAASAPPNWSSLLPDLLGQVIARLPHIADRARFRAVCRSWHSAVRLHVSPQRRLPSVVLLDGTFLTLSDGGIHRAPFGKNTECVGSTGDWIALDCKDEATQTHTYRLHNHFSGATVPLPELDSIIGYVPQDFQIRKVVMRSTPQDLVAVTCNTWKYPLILCRPGKGVWVPRLLAMPYFRICDILFSGDKLYVITKAEDLFALHLAEDDDGKPTVKNVKRIIRHAPGHEDDMYDVGMWKRLTDIDSSSDEDSEEDSDDEALCEEDNNEVLSQEDAHNELVGDDSDTDDDRKHLAFMEEDTFSECEDGVREGWDAVHTSRHLVRIQGKLLMIKRERLIAALTPTHHTRKVEVFEADMDACAWIPTSSRLGDGQAIFISYRFTNIVPACGEVEEDVIYFPDTNDVFDIKSKTIRLLMHMNPLHDRWRATWVFPPNLVV